MTPKIAVRELVKAFPTPDGGQRVVLDRVSFSLPEGTFVSAVGPSGCGKSTLLNIVAGLLPATAGTVELSGQSVTVGQRRGTPVGYVFQQPRLLNWLTVEENIEFALQASEVPRPAWGDRVREALRLVGLEPYRRAYPLRLSGGQQQRVAIARALAIEPEVVLMDEPFSHLDEITAGRLREELMEIWERTGKTVLFITHSITEAVLLSESIIVLGPNGRVVEELAVDVPRPRAGRDDALFRAERRVRQVTAKWWVEPDTRRPA